MKAEAQTRWVRTHRTAGPVNLVAIPPPKSFRVYTTISPETATPDSHQGSLPRAHLHPRGHHTPWPLGKPVTPKQWVSPLSRPVLLHPFCQQMSPRHQRPGLHDHCDRLSRLWKAAALPGRGDKETSSTAGGTLLGVALQRYYRGFWKN